MDTSGREIRSILSNSFQLINAQGITSLARLAYVVTLARILGPELYGLYSYGMSWYLVLLPGAALGMDLILGRHAGRYGDKNRAVLHRSLLVCTIAASCLALLLSGSAWLLEGEPRVRFLTYVFSIALLARAVAIWSNFVFSAFEMARYVLRVATVFRVGEVLLGIAYVAPNFGLEGVVVLHALSWIVQAVAGVALVAVRVWAVQSSVGQSSYAAILREGVPLGAIGLLTGGLMSGPIVLFRFQAGSEEILGQFALAMQVCLVLSVIPTALARSAMPVLSRTISRDDSDTAGLVSGLLLWSALFWGFASLVAVEFSPALFTSVFGQRYATAGSLFSIALLILWPVSLSVISVRVLAARQLLRQQWQGPLVGAVILLTGMPLLAMAYSATGALMATHAALWSHALILLFFAGKQVSINLPAILGKPIVAISSGWLVFWLCPPTSSGIRLALVFSTFFLCLAAMRTVTKTELANFAARFSPRG
jgi:O-antigen/teichoic acid export membrane protein